MSSTLTRPEVSGTPVPQTLSWQQWAIALTASLAAILEVIDTSIVNVALVNVQASLGATLAEVSWVVTGYGIGNVIVLPLSAKLGDRFGKKAYFLFSLVGFTAASVLCGLAVNLPMLVVARLAQGLLGGGLLAKAQAILFETFPPTLQGLAQAIFGVGVITGPAIGPTLGGYLTDNFGWRWIFFINLPVGIAAVVMALIFLPEDPVETRASARLDGWGILWLALMLGSLQTLLEEGERQDWFDAAEIRQLAVVAAIAFGLFLVRELRTPDPAVDLRVLRHRSLALGSLYSAVIGIGLYGTLFIIPIYAQSVLHFTAQQTGLLLLPGALASAVTMTSLGKVINRFDPRVIISAGALITVGVMLNLSDINPDTGTDSMFWPLLIRGVGIVMMFLPLSLVALGPLPKADIAAGSGFYNLTRLLGGSIGVAALASFLSHQRSYHRGLLSINLSEFSAATQDRLQFLQQSFLHQGFARETAHQLALTQLDRQLELQANLLAYADVFRVVALLFLLTLPLVFWLSRPPSPDQPG